MSHVSACASGAHAIGEAAETIARGDAVAMVAGGAEAAITPIGLAGFCQGRALSTSRNDDPETASRPFDALRDGFVPAEGAGVLVLENMEFARGRGARVHARLIGYGASADAYHITAPPEDGAGAVQSMERALAAGRGGRFGRGLHQRPRDFDADRRHSGNHRSEEGFREASREHPHQLHEVDVRAFDRRGRFDRSDRMRQSAAGWHRPADYQL